MNMSCTKCMGTKRTGRLVPGFQHQTLTEQLNSCQDRVEQVHAFFESIQVSTVVANLY